MSGYLFRGFNIAGRIRKIVRLGEVPADLIVYKGADKNQHML
jgi:hypothetical protein